MTKKQIEKQREIWRIRKMVQRLIKIQNSDCRICGATERLERHHIDGKLNNNSLGNITIICSKCHHGIHIDMNKDGRIKIE
jgi:5-methylcytosine-specific restriction endonuclease McrA